ncbi:MAG TPA: 4'-phosphopantetheinyl transferase superfamily protein [Polyangiaceae bacterium]|nr:4'-phosphopantetheinyl transferase superfamily protein [Polyangiaceae bacterium]
MCELGEAHGREKRMREFAAGRHCAEQALLDAGAREVTVGVGRDRAPLWPPGFVGSITHSNSFAWAAVARSSDLRSLGVDSEPLFDDQALSEALCLALDAGERSRVEGERSRELATLGFSAKESLFKCLYPCSGIFFYFADAELEWIAADGDAGGTFGLRLRRGLGAEFPSGMRLSGRYAVELGHVHTAVELQR